MNDRHGALVATEARRPPALGAALRRIALTWLLLLGLGALEFAASFLPLPATLRPLLMIPAVLMVIGVAIGFMEVGSGPTIVRGFAVAALFWLFVLLGLGSADSLTRTDYLVPHSRTP
jgi:hypothetical protein